MLVRLPILPEGTTVRRRPGRPTKVHKAPVVDEADYTALVDEARRAHVEGDGLVALGVDARPEDVLEAVITRVAQEVAGLAFDAQRAEAEGRDASQTRGRRIKGLIQLAGILLDREHVHRERGGLTEEAVVPIKDAFVVEVREAAEVTLPPEKLDVFLERLDARLGP